MSTLSRVEDAYEALLQDMASELTELLFNDAVFPATLAWFSESSPVSALEQHLIRHVNSQRDAVQRKAERRIKQFQHEVEDILGRDINSSRMSGSINTTNMMDSQNMSKVISQAVSPMVGLVTTSFIAMISGGSGVALVASGPIGIIIGIFIGLFIYAKGKKEIDSTIKNTLMTKNIPPFAKHLVKGRVFDELAAKKGTLETNVYNMLKRDTISLLEEINKIAK